MVVTALRSRYACRGFRGCAGLMGPARQEPDASEEDPERVGGRFTVQAVPWLREVIRFKM